MAPDRLPALSRKRKEAPTNTSSSSSNKKPKPSQRPNFVNKRREARTLSTQTTSKAFKNGELDVDKFVKAREYEIRALEDGLTRSKKALNQRAFQQVPKALRRRTASHNAKKVPKRLRDRAKREMVEDNTPAVTAKTRKKSGHLRLRLETARKLRSMGSRSRPDHKSTDGEKQAQPESDGPAAIKTRAPKVKTATLAQPPVAKAKFRKRQIHKSWLPTHMFHTKRAHMTAPSQPLWRFSIPLSPTEKSYRPTHRASTTRGCIAWDMSYVSTIGMSGPEASILGVLRAMGLDEIQLTGKKGSRWRSGARVLDTFIWERETPQHAIAPVTAIWCASLSMIGDEKGTKRKLFLRIQPAAFFQAWEEVLRLAKIAKPQVSVEDLRFEIGSIEIIGPGSTEALLGALWPASNEEDLQRATDSSGHGTKDADTIGRADLSKGSRNSMEETWTSLAGLTNPSSLPLNALLGFSIQDPRLHHPPRAIKLPSTEKEQNMLIDLLGTWPVDNAQRELEIFDRRTRLAASAALATQKSINRRKSLARPGQYPDVLPKDPKIPVLLYTSLASHTTASDSRRHGQSSWTLLLPWQCVQLVWYSIIYYPLSTGQQAHFGGLDQVRQLAFEAGKPWFPADFPGTKAGWDWEMQEREKRKDAWQCKPKSKRVSWETVDLGLGKKGEVGVGWACDWELLKSLSSAHGDMNVSEQGQDTSTTTAERPTDKDHTALTTFSHLPSDKADALLTSSTASTPATTVPHLATSLITVRFTLLNRGVPHTCARVYRLPSDPIQRKIWLSLLPSKSPRSTHHKKTPAPRFPRDAPAHEVQRFLAREILTPVPKVGDPRYPTCPGEEDLIGFVTTGNFNLGEGQGTGVGSLLVAKLMATGGGDASERRLCVVRNSGEGLGRLARWDLA